MKRALITGINGMDGSHLADLLLSKGYKVYGMERRSSSKHRANIAHIEDQIEWIIKNRGELQRLSLNSRSFVSKHHSYKSIAKKYVDQFQLL